MKLVIHMGLHRTGSTALKAWLEERRASFTAARRFLFSDLSSGSQGSLFGVLIGKTLRLTGPAAAAAVVEEELARLAGSFDGGLVSDENLLGPMPGSEAQAFAALPVIASTLELLAVRHTVQPVLVLRQHGAWLNSLYRIAQFRGDPRSFVEFASDVLPDGQGFAPLLDRLALACGRPPLVTTLEAITADRGEAFLARLMAAGDVARFAPGPLAASNAAPPPILGYLRQEVARRGGFLALEAAPELVELLASLGAASAYRNSANLAKARDGIVRQSLRLDPALAFAQRLERAAKCIETGTPVPFLGVDEARSILVSALAASDDDHAGVPDLKRIAPRFAADGQELSRRYATTWTTATEENAR
ncbi:MAG: hypothetical protein HY245_04015 [Rhizobiales bacterium]|nr:hypothetical protein [Hyphomicrobiales bacterium]MBI3672587.1 hypothetical protein [Hyphomicrobiales bacterium]